MTQQELDEVIKKRIDQINRIEAIFEEHPSLMFQATYIGDPAIYVEGDRLYSGFLSRLHSIRSHGIKLDLESYFASGGKLIVVYKAQSSSGIPFELVFSISEVEIALEKISNGKCHLRHETRISQEVVCDI